MQLFAADPWTPVALVGAWVLAVLFTGVRIPSLDPAAGAEIRPMESAATILLAAAAAVQAAALEVRAPWLIAVSPRRLWHLRMGWLAGQTALGAGLCAAAVPFMPAGVSTVQVTGVWLICLALAVGGICASGVPAATIAPAAFILVFSLGNGIPPWQVNIVYNPVLAGRLQVIAAVAVLLAAALYVAVGPAGQRAVRHLG